MNGAVERQTLEESLAQLFGFDRFREGQRDVCSAVIEGRDVCVFWATGHGKSLVYQLPALHLQRPVLVISPLISLMEDQCVKLNATVGEGQRTIAVALNSASKHDAKTEAAVWRGEVPVVYVSPERVAMPGFVSQLEMLQRNTRGLAFIAVDEAHCICEWGHDFRKEYKLIGNLRQNPVLSKIPIMALTATAAPKQREEICTSLSLRSPHISLRTFDRPNLKIHAQPKSTYASNAERYQMIGEKLSKANGGSAIIYVATRKQCETVESELRQRTSMLSIASYHAGKSQEERKQIHLDFLNGQIQVIVATIAFGMGIDKPDIRFIIHDGPSKTMEEYFQQIGRAGRDGRLAECYLYYTESEFTNYRSDFYMGGLTGEARAAQEKSLLALRQFASNAQDCRRRLLLEFFEEEPVFNRCKMCDNCVLHDSVDDPTKLLRDFTDEARILLKAVSSTETFKLGISSVVDVISGVYKPKSGMMPTAVGKAMNDLSVARKALKSPYSKQFYKDLAPQLVRQGYLATSIASFSGGGYTRNYETFQLTAKGRANITGDRAASRIMLPASPSLLEQEAQQLHDQMKRAQELEEAGIDLSLIPSEEIEQGKGPVLSAFQHWIRTLKHYRESGRSEYAERLDQLLQSLIDWRVELGKKLGMAPVTVLSDHLARRIAYSQPTDVEALRSVGVRVANAHEVCDIIRQWKQAQRDQQEDGGGTNSSNFATYARALRLPETWTPPAPFAVFVPKAKPAPWEISYDRFQLRKEHPQVIALSQASGKPIQVATVFGHLCTALTHGKTLDLKRAMTTCDIPIPDYEAWDQYKRALVASQLNVLDASAQMKPILAAILGEELVGKEDKSEAEKTLCSKWYALLRLFMTFDRAHVPVDVDAADVIVEESESTSPANKRRKL